MNFFGVLGFLLDVFDDFSVFSNDMIGGVLGIDS